MKYLFILWNSFKLTFNRFSIAFDNVRPFGPERPWGARAGIITSEVDFNLYIAIRKSLCSISNVLMFKWNLLIFDLLWIGGEFKIRAFLFITIQFLSLKVTSIGLILSISIGLPAMQCRQCLDSNSFCNVWGTVFSTFGVPVRICHDHEMTGQPILVSGFH